MPRSAERDLELWHEFEQASRATQAITWSKGLHQLLGMLERSDEDLAVRHMTSGKYRGCGGPARGEARRGMVGVPGLRASVLEMAEAAGGWMDQRPAGPAWDSAGAASASASGWWPGMWDMVEAPFSAQGSADRRYPRFYLRF